MPGSRLRAVAIILSTILLLANSLRKGSFFRRMKPSLRSSYGTGPIQIPNVDDRKYVQHVLSNGIVVTVVQDEKSEKCSCALSVKTGAMYDPQPGVAHITEHAVFLGSEKYPIENAYKDFLNKHGGSSNAGTSMDQTTYKFSVNSNAFNQALDIFSQFFKGPLFRTEAMCREIMAVDSEDSKNRIIDSRRLLQVLKHQVDPDSRYSKFSTGNLNTLAYGDEKKYGQHLADTIRSFHQRYYHPQAMAVALVGPQSVDDLRELAERHFSGITGFAERDDTPYEEWGASPTRTRSLFTHGGGKLIRLRPIKDLRDMIVVWELPATHELYRTNPCYLLSYLLANKGEGSWFAALQDRQWATSTASGVRTHFVDFTLFEATVSLTEAGLRHWDEVMELLYRSIDALSRASDTELVQYWQEMRTINSLDFQYKEKNTAYELAPHLSSNMLDYPAQHIVSAGWLMDEDVDLELFRSYLSKLAREKSVVFLRSKTFADAPLSLGSDDATYLHERVFPGYEAHVRNSHYADGNSSSNSGSGEGAAVEAAYAAIEALKLSGDYFHNLRAHQDGMYRTAASGAVDKTESAQRMEPFYGIPYRIDDLATAVAEAAAADRNADCLKEVTIALPPPNRFLCTELIDGSHILHEDRSSSRAREEDCASAQDTEPKAESDPQASLRPRQSAPPVPVGGADTPRERAWVWHSRDQVFRQPRAIFFHRLESAACEDGHPVLSLMAQVFSQVTVRKYYQPAVAGLSYSFSLGPRGVGLSFYGYSPKLTEFAADVSRDVGGLSFWSAVPPSVVEMCRDRLLRTYRSWAKERPDAQCDSLLRYLLHEGTWLPKDRLAACEAIDTAYFQHRVANVLQLGRVLTYAHGDCSPETAQACHAAVAANIHAASQASAQGSDQDGGAERAIVAERSRLLPPASHYTAALPAFNQEDPNSALLTFFQADMAAPEVSAHMLLLRRLLGEPAFAELRTKQQLGYIVSLSSSGYGRGWNAMRGISVRILSKRFSPVAMEASLDAFLATQRSLLRGTLTDEAVRERCVAIIRSLEDPPTTYTEEASEYWDSIVHGLPFDWTQRVIAALRALDREAVLRRAEEWVFDPATRRSVSLMVFSSAHEPERQRLVESRGEEHCGGGLRGSAGNEFCFSVDDLVRVRDGLPFAANR